MESGVCSAQVDNLCYWGGKIALPCVAQVFNLRAMESGVCSAQVDNLCYWGGKIALPCVAQVVNLRHEARSARYLIGTSGGAAGS